MKVQAQDDNEQPAVNALNMFISIRHCGLVPWEGGFVYPTDEIKKIIKALRNYRNRA